jgi:hypothetical protein
VLLSYVGGIAALSGGDVGLVRGFCGSSPYELGSRERILLMHRIIRQQRLNNGQFKKR